jgi:hypothetical protein
MGENLMANRGILIISIFNSNLQNFVPLRLKISQSLCTRRHTQANASTLR